MGVPGSTLGLGKKTQTHQTGLRWQVDGADGLLRPGELACRLTYQRASAPEGVTWKLPHPMPGLDGRADLRAMVVARRSPTFSAMLQREGVGANRTGEPDA